MSTSSGQEMEVIEFFMAAEMTKTIALISSTIFIFDTILTLPQEIRYVWSSRWSFARVAFHVNRLWSSVVLGLMCIIINTYYVFGTAITAMIVAIIIIVRVWLIYGRKSLVLGSLAVSVPSLVLLQRRDKSSKFIPNPAPGIIAGCTLKASSFGVGAYIGPLIYETILFILTLYKSWSTFRTPLMQWLMRGGSKYYAVVLVTLVVIGLGSINRETKRAFLSSGLLTAIFSAMCSRLILSGFSYSDDNKETTPDLEAGRSGSISFASIIPGSEWVERLE
ncbi:hypothetical protein B0J17DRAFT_658044 [Rhizoctonia solani]|nr:hypothetical protein B0J17DRAFT_658044 [Rhizoctonia solani]